MHSSSYLSFFFVFFFKQKTAYEMRISDWSSDVCSSDLRRDEQVLEYAASFEIGGHLRYFQQVVGPPADIDGRKRKLRELNGRGHRRNSFWHPDQPGHQHHSPFPLEPRGAPWAWLFSAGQPTLSSLPASKEYDLR